MRPWIEVPPQLDRLFVITGGNGGLGLETARILGSRGARVVLACRSVEKGEAAARQVPGFDKGRVSVRQLDLGDLASVGSFVAAMHVAGDPVDVLVNNAGILGVPLARSTEGVEMHFATNYLGHFALALGMLPLLRDRVVVVGSREHRGGRLELDDLGWHGRPYAAFSAYRASKLANLIFMRELDRQLTKSGSRLRSVGAHPGAAASGITGSATNTVVRTVAHHGQRLVSMPTWRGALCTVYAATMDVRGGSYTGPHGRTELWGWPAPARMSAQAEDEHMARCLWDQSVALTGARMPAPAESP